MALPAYSIQSICVAASYCTAAHLAELTTFTHRSEPSNFVCSGSGRLGQGPMADGG
jgi:hypothetical protein